MSYARDPYDTDEPPCFCPTGSPDPRTTEEFCPAHGDPAKPAPEPPSGTPPAADVGVCLHAGQVCVETESCGCPCSFCLAESDEAGRRAEDDELGAFDMAPGQ